VNIGICGLDLAAMQVRLAAAHELSPSAPRHILAGPFFLDVAYAREGREQGGPDWVTDAIGANPDDVS